MLLSAVRIAAVAWTCLHERKGFAGAELPPLRLFMLT